MIYSIIIDWKRTLYDPENKELMQETLELLNLFKKNKIKVILIGKGGKDMLEEVDRLGIRDYFEKIIFQEGDKDMSCFKAFVSPDNPKDTVCIGDRIRSELAICNTLGTTTIWVRQGKFAEEEPGNGISDATYTTSSLKECLSVLKDIMGRDFNNFTFK